MTLGRTRELGQSWWLDDLDRRLIEEGELQYWIEEHDLCGMTSNPKIFFQAIDEGESYRRDIERLAGDGLSPEEIYRELTTKDVRAACDAFADRHRETERRDGYVSLEVSPHLAYDTRGTIEEGEALFEAVGRPNVMIKVPGTQEGHPAIEELLFRGVPVNVTLLFSLDAYQGVIDAFFSALERRERAGLDVEGVHSVASFFLSRIDVLVDRLLEHRVRPKLRSPRPEALRSRVAIALAKTAYRLFEKSFSGEAWEHWERCGVQPQRLLFASTTPKREDLPKEYYFEPLVGPQTVSTLAREVAEAASKMDPMKSATLEDGYPEAQDTLLELAAVPISLERVGWQLEHEGVQKFIDPYDATLDRIREIVGEAKAPSASP